MKGVLFNVVEEVVDETLPEGTWDRALDSVGVRGAYTSLGNYPDEQAVQIVGSISEQSGLPVPDVLRHAGQHGFGHLIERHPELMTDIHDLPTLMARLDHNLQAVHFDADGLRVFDLDLNAICRVFLFHSHPS